MMCFIRGPNPLTVSAVLRGLRSSFIRHNSKIVESVRRQALNGEETEDLMEPTMFTEMQESGGTIEDSDRKTRNLERQDKELMGRLDETEKRISALIAGQISLRARVASREESTPLSYGKRL